MHIFCYLARTRTRTRVPRVRISEPPNERLEEFRLRLVLRAGIKELDQMLSNCGKHLQGQRSCPV